MHERSIDLTLSAPVFATDALVGRIEHIVIDPSHGRAAYLVAREAALPNTLRLVPEKYVASSDDKGVHLNIDAANVAGLREYVITDY